MFDFRDRFREKYGIYGTWEGFFDRIPIGLQGFKEKLTDGKKSVTRNSDELVSLFYETGVVDSEKDAKELTSWLDDFRLFYKEGFLAIRKRRENDKDVYLIDTCFWNDFY